MTARANDADVKNEVAAVLAVILEVPREAISDGFSPDDCETWDSVRHLRLVLAIEERFGVTFDEAEIEHLTSLRAILDALEKRLAG